MIVIKLFQPSIEDKKNWRESLLLNFKIREKEMNRNLIFRKLTKTMAVCTVIIGSLLPHVGGADTLRMAVPSDPTYVDPAYWGNGMDQFLIDNLFPRLGKPVAGDEWKFELDAAKSMDFSDPQNIKFELKPGILWSNGYGELTAEDVKYSFERHKNPELESALLNDYETITEVEVTGKYTGIIHYAWEAAPFWVTTLTYTNGAIISKKALEEAGGYFAAQPTTSAGPYKVKEVSAGERYVLERDPNWIGDAAHFDEIVMIPINDENAAEIAFAAGEIDFTLTTFGNKSALQNNLPEGGVIKDLSTINPYWLGMNMEDPALTDIRVRKAIQLAIDVPAILEATDGPGTKQATGLAAQGMIGYRDELPIKRDVEKAKKLIQEAGAEGTTLKLSYAGFAIRMTAGQIIQSNLAEIGINVELDQQNDATFWDVTVNKPENMQLSLKEWTGNPDLLYTFQYYTDEMKGEWNWEYFSDTRFSELRDAAWVESDEAKRGEMYKEMQTIMEDSGAFLFINNPPALALYNNKIKPGMLPDGRPIFGAFGIAE